MICSYSSIQDGQTGQTPLFLALLTGHNETADLLISHGADLYQEDEVSHIHGLIPYVLRFSC